MKFFTVDPTTLSIFLLKEIQEKIQEFGNVERRNHATLVPSCQQVALLFYQVATRLLIDLLTSC